MFQYRAIVSFGQMQPDKNLSRAERIQMNVPAQQQENYCVAHCPSCGQVAKFIYSGEQHWPEEVARAAGIAPIVTLWLCSNCGTTISEHDLEL
ncbi:MAG: hypothetical protein CUN54_07180 [Phototrophicales bacterium]|nr:MAG: hypothetical protein CUN54_07180 [Phototrophicales bacterium]